MGRCAARHALTNDAATPYLLEGLEVTLPLPAAATEVLDFTGRHEGERAPQRHPITDGLWLRESRRGKPGLDAASVLVAGTAGFGFATGELLAVSVGHSGNSVVAVAAQRGARGHPQRRRAAAARRGRAARGRQLHDAVGRRRRPRGTGWTRRRRPCTPGSARLPAHPQEQPVTLNVWEAVYFDHDADRLRAARRPRRPGRRRAVRARRRLVPRPPRRHRRPGGLVGRRDGVAGRARTASSTTSTAWACSSGCGSSRRWSTRTPTSTASTPTGSCPPRGGCRCSTATSSCSTSPTPTCGPTSATGSTRSSASTRSTTSSGTTTATCSRPAARVHGGRPGGARARTPAYYALLDDLRGRHPHVRWESCAAGGGRIDLGVDRAGAAVLDLGHDRRAGPPAHPALDRAARRPGVPRRARLGAHVAPDRPDLLAGLPGGHRVLPRLRHRVGPDPGERGRARRARRVVSSCTSGSGRCCTPGGPSGSTSTDPAVLAHGVVAAGPGQRHRSATSSSTSPRTTAAARCGCRASTRRDLPAGLAGPGRPRGPPSMSPALSADGPTAGAPVTGRRARPSSGSGCRGDAPRPPSSIHVTRADDEA